MEKLLDFISKYYTRILYFLSLQIFGLVFFKIYGYQDFKYLFIISDIVIFAYLLSVFANEVLNIRNKTLDYILVGIAIFIIIRLVYLVI
ncbi:MAG TPA: hypothetical protein DCS12_00335 [Clostridiales bacterium]|nr:hypothetical protein [Clostridiales bacterium]